MQRFSSYFLKKRLEAGLQAKQVAEKAAINPFTLGKIEKGQSDPTIFTLIRLCRAWNLDLQTFAMEMEFPNFPLREKDSTLVDPVSIQKIIQIYAWSIKYPEKLDELEKQIYTMAFPQMEGELWRSKLGVEGVGFYWMGYERNIHYIKKNKIIDLLNQGSVVTFKELGDLVAILRREKKQSLAKMKINSELSVRFLNFVENAKQTEYRLSEIILLDHALDADGLVIQTAWEATKFWSGMVLFDFPQIQPDLTEWKKRLNQLVSIVYSLRWLESYETREEYAALCKLLDGEISD